eukprot:6451214-Pyramimonas_sp.AAC.1
MLTAPLDRVCGLYPSVPLYNVVGDITAQSAGTSRHVEFVLPRAVLLLCALLEKLHLVISQSKGLVMGSHSVARVCIVRMLRRWNFDGVHYGRNL